MEDPEFAKVGKLVEPEDLVPELKKERPAPLVLLFAEANPWCAHAKRAQKRRRHEKAVPTFRT